MDERAKSVRGGLRRAAAAALALAAGLGVLAWSVQSNAVPAVPRAATGTPPDSALVGTRWLAVTLDGDPVVATDSGEVPHLQVNAADATGGDPCNSMRSDYALDGTALRFVGWTATEMACGSQQVVAQQGRYARALAATASFRLSGDTLDLLSADGTVLASFTRTAFQAPSGPAGTLPASPDTPVSSEEVGEADR